MKENTDQPNETNSAQVQRLPLWKACLDDLISNGVEYGMVIPTSWFEERLHCNRDSIRFGLDVAKIRRELEHRGFYICGRGHKGESFEIIKPEDNVDQVLAYQRLALDSLRRGMVLGSNTNLETLDADQKRRHESVMERIGIRLALMQRSTAIHKLVEKAQPKLLG